MFGIIPFLVIFGSWLTACPLNLSHGKITVSLTGAARAALLLMSVTKPNCCYEKFIILCFVIHVIGTDIGLMQ